jgi:hypothetical protein
MLKGFYLTLLMGPVIPVLALQPVIDALTSVQVTSSAGQRSGFQITFGLSKESILNRVLLPAGYFDPEIKVVIIVTVNGTPNVLMEGVITQQSVTPSNEPGQSTLAITGEDLSLLMDLENRRTTYSGQSRDTRVRKILARYAIHRIIPMVVPPLQADVDNPLETVNVQNSTDLAYINQLASEVGYVFYIEPGLIPGANLNIPGTNFNIPGTNVVVSGTKFGIPGANFAVPGTNIAYWGPEIRIGLPQPDLNVNMDAQTNVESLSFTFDGLSRTQMEVEVTVPIIKRQVKVPIPDVGLLRPPLAARPAVALRKEPLKCTSHMKVTRALLLGLARTAEASDAISGSGQLDTLRYGHILKARGLVSVRGAGIAYDGLYYVKSVTHNIKRGEYKQSFTLARDGLISLTALVMS